MGVSEITGEQFRKCRKAFGGSPAEFAATLGLAGGAKAVQEIETGKRTISGPLARWAICLAGGWPYLNLEPPLFRACVDADNEASIDSFFAEAGEDWSGD